MNHVLYFVPSLAIAATALGAGGFGFADAFDPAAVVPTAPALAEYRLAQSSRAARMRAEIELRQRKMKAKMERQRQEFERKRIEIERQHKEARRAAERSRKQIQRQHQEIRNRISPPSRISEPPPFNPSAAPDPKVCFEDFVKKIRSADSVDDFIIYLPLRDQEYLRHEQAEYDPQEVPAKRARFLEMRPDISEDTLHYLTQSPYERALERYQRIAKKFRHTQSVKVDGNKAILNIATFNTATQDGVEYNYSSATVELVGEANYWRMTGYEDSSVHYMYPQD